MTSQPAPGTPEVPDSRRIGAAEREHAMQALDTHMTAGRLDPDEYAERAARASVARTAADLAPLFTDLPAPGPMTISVASVRKQPAQSPAVAPGPESGNGEGVSRPGKIVVAITPFVALILFFLTQGFWDEAWLFFLLIPVVAIVVGAGSRNENRNERHNRRH